MSIKDKAVDDKVYYLIGKYNDRALEVAIDIYHALPNKTNDDESENIYTVNNFWAEVVSKINIIKCA